MSIADDVRDDRIATLEAKVEELEEARNRNNSD